MNLNPFSWFAAWMSSVRAKRLEVINQPVVPPAAPPAEVIHPAIAALSVYPQAPRSSRFEQSPDFASGGDVARKIELIIIHCTEGAMAGAVTWMTTKDATPVSAHYIVGKAGDIVQMVGENDVAYHAGGTKEKPSSWRGRGNINGRSIGIEIEQKGTEPYTPTQLSVLLGLLLRICRRYNLTAEQVVGHDDVDPGRKTDPRGFPWATVRASLAFHLSRPGGIV